METQPKLTRSDVFEAFSDSGWSPDGAVMMALHFRDRPSVESTVRNFAGKVNSTKYRSLGRTLVKPKATISPALRKKIFERDAYRCKHCGVWEDLTVDHIKPEALGGTLDPENLQTLCRTCNCKKGTKLPSYVDPST